MSRRIHKLPGVIPTGRIAQPKPRPSRRAIGIFFGLLFLGGAYWFFAMSTTFAIDRVEVIGTNDTSVQAMAERFLGRNIFRLNETAVEQDLQQAHPPVARVRLVRGLPRTIRIEVSLRDPAIRWQAAQGTFIMDSQGQIFALGENESHQTLPKVVDKSNATITLGQQLVTPAFITFIQAIQTQVEDKFKRKHTANEIMETTSHLDVILEGDLRIRLTTQRPLEEQLDGALAIFTAHPDAKLIDVRVPKWGYWKK
jgi:hypothetical protein